MNLDSQPIHLGMYVEPPRMLEAVRRYVEILEEARRAGARQSPSHQCLCLEVVGAVRDGLVSVQPGSLLLSTAREPAVRVGSTELASLLHNASVTDFTRDCACVLDMLREYVLAQAAASQAGKNVLCPILLQEALQMLFVKESGVQSVKAEDMYRMLSVLPTRVAGRPVEVEWLTSQRRRMRTALS